MFDIHQLFECVGNMTAVDLATLMTNGYLDDDPDSDSYGNFTSSAGGLNVSLFLPLLLLDSNK